MEAVRTPSGTGVRAKHRSLVFAKKRGGGKLLPLPFTTFSEIVALGFKARVYCPSCYEHRPIDTLAENLRDRCFATTRFRSTKIRCTGKSRASGAKQITASSLIGAPGAC
jgi:hypothetical protein